MSSSNITWPFTLLLFNTGLGSLVDNAGIQVRFWVAAFHIRKNGTNVGFIAKSGKLRVRVSLHTARVRHARETSDISRVAH